MGPVPRLDAAPVPRSVVHAWHDEIIPAMGVVEWARARSARLLLLDDSHRLSAHVETTARAFAELLETLSARWSHTDRGSCPVQRDAPAPR